VYSEQYLLHFYSLLQSPLSISRRKTFPAINFY
jgi:hypothetical protein